MELWRRTGPLGKLHNIITWIYRSPQRRTRFLRIQTELLKDLSLVFGEEEGQRPQDLYRDNATRWNSTFRMVRQAIKLRLAIVTLFERERERLQKGEVGDVTPSTPKKSKKQRRARKQRKRLQNPDST